MAAKADLGGETMMQVVLQRFSQPAVREALDRLCWELASKQELVYELLQRLDRNGDGRLSRDELRHGLRSMGVSVQMHAPADSTGGMGSMKSQFKKADASGARFALIFGPDELAQSQVTVKALRDGEGAQSTEALQQIADWGHSLQSTL